MRFFPVVNLSPRLGQVKEFEILKDQQLARIQDAVNSYNEWKDWSDTPIGDRYMRDAIADVQSALNSVPESVRLGAMQEIQKYVDNSEDLIGHLQMPGPGTSPAIPPSQTPVASVDRSRELPPPPPNNNPPVASGQPGPGAGAFRGQGYPSVASGQPGPGYSPITFEPSTTGSEPEPEPPATPTPPPPPIMGPPGGPYMPPPTMPPPVATQGSACWYVIGQGYSWGARPSGGETTGLNQSDCMAIQANYNSVRGLPNVTTQEGQTAQNVTNTQNQQTTETMYNPNAPMAPQEPAPVATPGACPPGQFWDGRQCRGSVAPGFGGLTAGLNLGPSGAGMPAGNVAFGGEGGFSSGGAPGEFSMVGRVRPNMGRRSFPVVNL